MVSPQVLGALNNVQQLLVQLVDDLPATEVNRRFHSALPSMGWLLGRSVYLELWWLRARLQDDPDLCDRVRHIFTPSWPDEPRDHWLPPKDHLLNWALEIQEQHLTWLANPRLLPEHPWLRGGWLAEYMLQNHSLIYEQMLAVRHARAVTLHRDEHFRVERELRAQPPTADSIEVSQGHYRIGAREGVVFDNEQPMQMVEMRNFRICKQPVSNAAWLAFMQAGGYRDTRFWSEAGQAWLAKTQAYHPWHWRQDRQGHWYALGLNGPADLPADQPVSGISWHEAQAFCRWAATTLSEFKGAILPHEYHWEAAARIGAIQQAGRVWEWCENTFAPYVHYEKPRDPEMATVRFDGQHKVLRGGCLHTQPCLRRISIRHADLPEAQTGFAGVRLVLPPALENEALYIEQWQKFLQ